jgi:hypothetical protein
MVEGLQDVDTAIRLNPALASVFLSEMLSTEQAADLLGVSRRVLAVWRQFQVGPAFVTLKRGRIGYPPEGVKRFLRDRERRKQERENQRQNPRTGKSCK